jgi:hypothetical protein
MKEAIIRGRVYIKTEPMQHQTKTCIHCDLYDDCPDVVEFKCSIWQDSYWKLKSTGALTKKEYLIYEESSNTLRQMPQNYLIAERPYNRWIVDSDLAANKEICKAVFEVCLTFEGRYSDPIYLIEMTLDLLNHKKRGNK